MKLSWKQLASIEIGGAICLPVILVGHTLCMKYGFTSALSAILAGNLFLLGVALLSAHLSVTNRCSTPEQAEKCFGIKGVRLFAIVLMLTKMGWFAIQLTLMSESIKETVFSATGLSVPVAFLNIGFGCLIVLPASFGLKALTKISSIGLPLMIGTLISALFITIRNGSFTLTTQDHLLGVEAVSVAIAAAITAVLDMPTYFRFAETKKDAYIAVGILFIVCLPFIEVIGVLLASFHPKQTLISTLLGTSLLWNGWMTLFLILAAWTTNNTNLYSAQICCGVLSRKFSEKQRMFLLGSFGTLFSFLPLLQHFTKGLQIMGVAVAAFGGVIYTAHFLKTKKGTIPFTAWILSAGFGWMSSAGLITITSIALCDGFLLAVITTGILSGLRKRIAI